MELTLEERIAKVAESRVWSEQYLRESARWMDEAVKGDSTQLQKQERRMLLAKANLSASLIGVRWPGTGGK